MVFTGFRVLGFMGFRVFRIYNNIAPALPAFVDKICFACIDSWYAHPSYSHLRLGVSENRGL